jgi:hypothetical protein
MRFIRYFFALFAVSAFAIVALLSAPNAAAQSFGVTTAQFFKRVGDAILPGNASWTIGSSGSRISTIYANTVDALSMAISGVVSGDLFVSGNGYIYGSGGLQTPKITATSTGLALQVDGRSLLMGAVTTTGGIFPAVAGGADLGSNTYPYGSVFTTGTSVLGGALTVTNGSGSGADRLQVGYEQSPAQGFMSTAPLNIYAPSTGYVDTFTMTAGGNGADGACFSAKNLGATLGRQCQVSGNPSYYIMGLNGLAFQGNNVTPGSAFDLVIRNNRIGVNNGGAVPNATLEVVGDTSSTRFYAGAGSSAAPSMTFGNDPDTGLRSHAANQIGFSAGGVGAGYMKAGIMYVRNDFASLQTGDGYCWGDDVRCMRYISGGDFEFQGWHLNKFYISRTNGGTPTRFAVFDGPTSRVAMSDAGTLLNYTPNAALEVLGSGVSSTQLNVNGTSTLRTLMLGGNTVVDNKSPLYINYTQTQAMNDAYTPTVFLRNASTTAYTSIAFRRGDNHGDIGTIEVYNENSAEPEMPFTTANKMLISSTSGTLMAVGAGESGPSAVAYLDENGAFRPITGLGFGGGFEGIGQSASTTIVDGNYASASLNFPNSASADDQDLTITVTGAQDGDETQCGIPNALRSRAREVYSCWVSAADTITVRRTCVSGAGCGDPSAVTVGAGYFHRQ